MLDQAAFKRWRKFLVDFKADGYKSGYTSQRIEEFVSEIINAGGSLNTISGFLEIVDMTDKIGSEEERKICTKFLLLFAPFWLSLKIDKVGPDSKASTDKYLFDLEFEWQDWDLSRVFDLVDKATLSNEILCQMVQLKHREMSTELNEAASSHIFSSNISDHINSLLSAYADIKSKPQESIPPDSSGNVQDGPKNVVGVSKPDEALTVKVPSARERRREGETEEDETQKGGGQGKKRKREESEEERMNRERAQRRQGADEDGKEELDERIFAAIEYKRYPLHKSLHDAFQNGDPIDTSMEVFRGKTSPFQQLGLQILASKCFGAVLTDSFHAFFTEINWKKLENGIKYQEENGVNIPVLPLVVKYVNLRSQSPSLPLSFASASIDWIERTRSELSEEKSRRHELCQTILDEAGNAADTSFDSSQDKKKDEENQSKGDASFDQNTQGENQSNEKSSPNPSQQTEPRSDKERPKKRSKGNPKGTHYELAANTEPVDPYDISMDTSIASHEDRPDKIPTVFVYTKDVIEGYIFDNCRIFKVKARALMEAIIPEDRAGLGDEDIVVVKVVVPNEDDWAYSKEQKKYVQDKSADKENAFIDQVLPYIPGFNNCYLRHRAVNIRIFGEVPYTAHFVLSRFIEHKDVPLETIKDKVEEQKRILRNGSVVHKDLQPRNILYDGEKVYIIDFGVAKHLVR